MYISPAFKIDDPKKIDEFIASNSFATLITQDGETPFASHLPLLMDTESGRLIGHMAINNPQWKYFTDGHEVLAIFHGPHAYISPRWYHTKLAVPTWNYAVVHVYGKPRLVSNAEELQEIVRRTVHFYEGAGPDAWRGDLPPDFEEKLLKGLVGFDIAITRIEAKFKLGQNRDSTDLASVHAALAQSAHAPDRMLADFMRQEGLVE